MNHYSHTPLLPSACALILLFSLTGCYSTGLSSRESGPGSYSQLVYEMARSQPANETALPLRKPIRLGVAQIGEVSPSINMLAALGGHPDLISDAIALPAPGDNRERFNGRPVGPASSPPANRLGEIRSLARAMGAEQVLILGGSIDTWTTRNALAPLDVTLVGMTMFPSVRLHGQGKAAGILLDVDSGAIRFQVQTERQRHGNSPSAFVDSQQDSLRVKLREDLALELAREFIHRLRAP